MGVLEDVDNSVGVVILDTKHAHYLPSIAHSQDLVAERDDVLCGVPFGTTYKHQNARI